MTTSAYISVNDAETYFAEVMYSSAWDSATSANKAKSLIAATRIIDSLQYYDDKASDSQANEFPRGDDTTVPTAIKEACCEIALALLQGVDPVKEFANLNVSGQSIGNLRTAYRDNPIFEHVVLGIPSIKGFQLLRPYLNRMDAISMERVS